MAASAAGHVARRIRRIVDAQKRQQSGEVRHADIDVARRGRGEAQRDHRGLDRLGEVGGIEMPVAVEERRQVQHEARRVRGCGPPDRLGRRAAAQQQQPVQPVGQRDVDPGGHRAGGDRVDPGLRRSHQRDRALAGGERRQRAAAASSQAAGRVIGRAGSSGSAPAAVRRIRTPCHDRWIFMPRC